MARDAIPVLREQLRVLHLDVGQPPGTALSDHAAHLGRALPRQTISDLLKGFRRPKWATVETFVLACLRHHDEPGRRKLKSLSQDDRRRSLGYWSGLYGMEAGPVVSQEQPRAAGPAMGRLLSAVDDPFDLEDHRVIEVASGGRPMPVLPRYVSREHDQRLRETVDAAVAGHSEMVVLVGGSSTGKTRALWEAVQYLRHLVEGEESRAGPGDRVSGWRVWHPLVPDRVEALLGGLRDALTSAEGDVACQVGPRTVIWLNELQHYVGPADQAAGERAAAGLRELLRAARAVPGRGPVLILGTLWPEHWRRLTADPPANGPDPYAQARAVLAGRDLRIPDGFIGRDQVLAEVTDADPRWKEALERGKSAPTQYLAGGYELVRRYDNAGPTVRAVLDAAGDVRRLGHPAPLPIDFLRDAAQGYLSDDAWRQLPPDQRGTWFDLALQELEQPCRGTPGPLTPARPSLGAGPSGRLELADYLEQHLRHARRLLAPPATLWNSAAIKISDPIAHADLAVAAYNRGRFRHGVSLACAAATASDTSAVSKLAWMREEAGDQQGAEQLYRAAADAGDLSALLRLARLREKAGDQQGAEQLYRAAAVTGDSLALHDLAQLRLNAGDQQGAEQLYRAAADTGDPKALRQLAWLREYAGDQQGAEALARAAAAGGDLLALRGLAMMREEAGDQQGAEQLYRAAADTGNPAALSDLVRLREHAGDQQGAETLVHEAIDAGYIWALGELAQLRKQAGDQQGAEQLYRAAADTGNLTALSDLARLREQAGDQQGAEILASIVAESGDPAALSDLVRLREHAGDQRGAQQLLQSAADAGYLSVLSHLATMRKQAGDQQGAEQLYRAVVASDRLTVLGDLVLLWEQAGDQEAAETLARAGADAGRTWPLRELAQLREQAGDQQGAEQLYRAAADTGDPAALSNLARIREQVGDLAGAEQLTIAAVNAGGTSALSQLARVRTALGRSGHAELTRFGLTADGQPEKPWMPADFGPITKSR